MHIINFLIILKGVLMAKDTMKETALTTTTIHAVLAQNLTKIIHKKKLSQSTLVSLCKEKGFKISQGTISNAMRGRGNVTLDTIWALSEVLETDISTLLNTSTTEDSSFFSRMIPHGDFFITSPDDPSFHGYLGDYSLLFYKTTGKDDDLLCGTLTLTKSVDQRKCEANFTLPTGDFKTTAGVTMPIEKKFHGELVISKSMHSAYVFLCSENIGEVSLLVFHHWYILNNDLRCAMASAITTSSGSNRRPTIHRACIIRGNVDSKIYPYLKGQLLLNTAEILLSQNELDKILETPEIPDTFKTLVKQSINNEKYYIIKENSLIDPQAFSEFENTKWISYMRANSSAPKYNKISKRTDDALFSLLFKGMQT